MVNGESHGANSGEREGACVLTAGPVRPICRRDGIGEREQRFHHIVRPKPAGQRENVCDRPSIMMIYHAKIRLTKLFIDKGI